MYMYNVLYNVQCTMYNVLKEEGVAGVGERPALQTKGCGAKPPLLPNHFGWLLFSAQSLANLVSKPTNVLHDPLSFFLLLYFSSSQLDFLGSSRML